jgi:hypothetical protein
VAFDRGAASLGVGFSPHRKDLSHEATRIEVIRCGVGRQSYPSEIG